MPPEVHYQMFSFRLLSERRWDMFSTSTLYAVSSPSEMGPTTVVSSLYWTETLGGWVIAAGDRKTFILKDVVTGSSSLLPLPERVCVLR